MRAPTPQRLTCPHCDWTRLIYPLSDVRLGLEVPARCPSCSNPDLRSVPASPIEACWARLQRRLRLRSR